MNLLDCQCALRQSGWCRNIKRAVVAACVITQAAFNTAALLPPSQRHSSVCVVFVSVCLCLCLCVCVPLSVCLCLQTIWKEVTVAY